MKTNVLFGYLGIGGLELSFIAGVILFSIVLALVPSVLSFIVLRRIPVEYRKQEPALAFLLVIPLFGVVWNFFVYPKISESLRLYYESKGDFGKGDCGSKLALWLCVMAACSFVPILGLFFGLASLVLFIVYFTKVFELSNNIGKISF